MKTAVIILNWNGKHFLEQFMPGVVEYSTLPGVEVVVADNGSDDGSVDYLRAEFPGVRLLLFEQNHGFTGGYNLACEQVDADLFVLLNADMRVTEGWLDPLVDLMKKDPEVAACQPRIRSFHQPAYFEYAGAAGGFIDRLGYPFCRGRILNVIEEDLGQYDQERDIFWATGACMMVRAECFREAGGFDPEFFAHMEEIDLCWRLKNMGYRIAVCPRSTVYHVGGGMLPNEHPRKLYLNFRNNLLTLCKNLPPRHRYLVMGWRFFLDMAAALKYLLSMKPRYSLAVFHACLSFWKKVPYCRRKRKEWLQQYPLLNHPEIFPGSVLYRFFIRRERKFSMLKF